MIFETLREKQAFEWMCKELDEYQSKRICNDLDVDMREKFKNFSVPYQDTNGHSGLTSIKMDFQLIEWLKNQIKEVKP
jgi:hypothetical protein